MKQKVFLLILLILFFEKYQAQVTNCNLSDLKGKIESVEISFFDVVKVDSTGNIIEKKTRKSLIGNSFESYKFDSSGREIESFRKSNDSSFSIHITAYNDIENLYVRRYFYGDNLKQIEVVILKKNHKTDTIFVLDSDSAINLIRVKSYNNKGLVEDERVFNKDYKEESLTKYWYYKNGILKKYSYYLNTEKQNSISIKYRRGKAVLESKSKEKHEIVKHYFAKKMIETYNKTRDEKKINYFELDSFGNYVLSIDSLFIDGNLARVTHKSYQYEYDSLGNWTRRVELVDGVPKMVAVRKYTYY